MTRFLHRRPSVWRLPWATCCGLVCLLVFVLLGPLTNSAQAQFGGRLPPVRYYRSFSSFYRADYRNALLGFRNSATTAFQQGDARFLDSLCAWTMMGECHFHQGNYGEALALYEQSIELYLDYTARQWQRRVQLPELIPPNDTIIRAARITWYGPKRNVRVARIPDEMSMMFGQIDAARVFEEGGVFNPAQMRSVDITEIMRCMALAIHRRRVIRGPTCKYHPLTVRMVNGLTGTITNTRTPLGAYNGVLRGLAQSSLENWDRATKRLKKSVQFGGGYDHSLSPIAYLELAHIGMATGNDQVAGLLALESSYSAAIFDQYDIVESALNVATMLHLKTNRTVFTPLENAIVWASKHSNLLHASLQVRLAECLAESGNVSAAARVLKDSQRALKREDVSKTIVANRYHYVAAVIQAVTGDTADSKASLSRSLDLDNNLSLSRFQMRLVDRLAASGAIGERDADLLYSIVLADPTDDQWNLDPFETMSALVFSRTAGLERWFETVVSRKDFTRAVDVAERLRRYRFYDRLPLSGRLLSFRWMLNAPSESVGKETLARRSQFFVRHPAYQDLVRQADQVQQKLRALPVAPTPKSDDAKQQNKLFREATEIAAAQEKYLAGASLLREPAAMTFPPKFEWERWQRSIKPGQQALVHVATVNAHHAFRVTDQGVEYLGNVKSRKMRTLVNTLLRSLKVSGSSLDSGDLDDKKWQAAARKLKQTLWPSIANDQWAGVKELVIVPDGWLWYVPFEALPIDDQAEDAKMLIDQVPIRYAPTLYSAFKTQRPAPPERSLDRAIVLTGAMSGRGEVELVQPHVAQLKKELPQAVSVSQLKVASGMFASVVDQWLVWAGLNVSKGQQLSFVPVPKRAAVSEELSLNSWIAFPWQGPRVILLPGFQSDAGTGLRNDLGGSDLFFTTLGLMASGTDEVLISRWNTSGDLSLQIANEYVKHRSTLPANQALRTSQQWARQQSVTEMSEPRLRLDRGQNKRSADHPLFWSSMLVVDVPSARPEPPPAAAVKQAPASGDPNAKQTAKPEEAPPVGAEPTSTTKESDAASKE